MKIFIDQANREYCMHTHDMIEGLLALDHEVYSTFGLYGSNGMKKVNLDLILVMTSGNSDNSTQFDTPYYFLDGRDEDTINGKQLAKAKLYFKTNLIWSHDKLRLLPSCTPSEQLPFMKISNKRDIPVSFFSSHDFHGRGDVQKWLKELSPDYMVDYIADDATPINQNFKAESCNMYSPKYYKLLNNSKISINAPGAGTSTKKFYEILASGAVCLNFVPNNYHSINADINNIVPEGCPWCPSFYNKEGLEGLIKSVLEDEPFRKKICDKQQAFARKWLRKDKAQFVLDKIKEVQ